jgi:hypothetical protein
MDDGGRGHASAGDVLLLSDWLEVVRIHAQSVAACVVNNHPARDFSDRDFVGVPVSKNTNPAVRSGKRDQEEAAVAS